MTSSAPSALSANEARLRELMLRGLAGDSGAEQSLLMQLALLLRTFLKRRMNADAADLEDLVQEILIAIHTRRSTYDVSQPLTAWVYALARYKLIDHFRRQRVRVAVPLDDCEELFEVDPITAHNDARDVDTLLSQLPGAQSDAIRLTRLEGLSVAEAALRSGQSESSIKVSVHRGLKKLGSLLGGRDEH